MGCGNEARTGEGEGVDVLAIVTACHELLTKTNGILALGDAVEDFELLLRNALCELSETWDTRDGA